MSKGRIILAGGSGVLGRNLERELLTRGYEPRILTRSPRGPRDVAWDGATRGDWISELEGARAVVNLTGRNVSCRHTAANRREILESRVASVEVLGSVIASLAMPPPVWVQAGSLAYFGDRGDEPLAEDAEPGTGFPADVCRRWEGAFASAVVPRTRKVFLRIGFVFDRDGGALPVLARFARMGVGRLGSGRQMVSWIDIRDFARITLWAIERDTVEGTYNVTAARPVTNAVLMAALREVAGRSCALPLPAWAVRIGAVAARTEANLALGGRGAIPARLLAEGFELRHGDLRATIRDLFGQPAREAAGR
jgi:uncharacterized protein (TIGR01777 family)